MIVTTVVTSVRMILEIAGMEEGRTESHAQDDIGDDLVFRCRVLLLEDYAEVYDDKLRQSSAQRPIFDVHPK